MRQLFTPLEKGPRNYVESRSSCSGLAPKVYERLSPRLSLKYCFRQFAHHHVSLQGTKVRYLDVSIENAGSESDDHIAGGGKCQTWKMTDLCGLEFKELENAGWNTNFSRQQWQVAIQWRVHECSRNRFSFIWTCYVLWCVCKHLNWHA